ncbi:MAG: energy-coupled thiamine transporter ThiT [Candidatus Wallbacteria bacterium HGW-Wallbacteria-1]|jgi:thiamine transporter|uniref:Energy-coupled thiamine transporter ThiT n=1 Tax=Candidatus Wallbacteria bacterium HGW-Wallbacteria-1 TaxID=2013854 RepID=A0A2N1PQ79_9BACT|nr:MAG: energy-coupled thiamine transporter ThiT [Candidatus Wallbacteria bacterium HGW-Wallbacteria-1]
MKQGSRAITRIALAAATAAVLSMIPLFRMPMGGSVSLRAIPLMILALTGGAREGVMAGIVYGFIHLVTGSVFVHWAQVILDFPLAFAGLGLAGLISFRMPEHGCRPWSAVWPVLLGFVARFSCHLVSGAIFFAKYAPAGWDSWSYSAVYNSYYLVPEFLITAGVVIYTPILRQAHRLRGDQ